MMNVDDECLNMEQIIVFEQLYREQGTTGLVEPDRR